MKLAIYIVIGLSLCSVARGATYGQKMVAAVLMAEAWSEGEVGMTAVAEVIRTRAAAAGVSPLAIVKVPKQFSCLNTTSLETLYRRFQNEPDFEKALQIARILYNTPEKLPGYARGADHFTRLDERPFWARRKAPIVVIGNHAFYRLGNYRQPVPSHRASSEPLGG